MISSSIRRGLSAVCRFRNLFPTTLERRASISIQASSSASIISKIGNHSTPIQGIVQKLQFTTTIVGRQQEQGKVAEKTQDMDDGERNIYDILTREFRPAHLEVRDVSGGCGSFYAIVVASEQFNGKPMVKAHRLVNEALKDVISGIHGLQLRTMPIKD